MPELQEAKANLPAVIERYLAGESMQTLAAEQGVHRATLYKWMLSEMGDTDYHDAVTHCLIQRVAVADGKAEEAIEGGDIARARAQIEMGKIARMDFERRRPHLYGQRPTTVVAVQVNGPPALPAVEELVAGYRAPVTIDNKE